MNQWIYNLFTDVVFWLIIYLQMFDIFSLYEEREIFTWNYKTSLNMYVAKNMVFSFILYCITIPVVMEWQEEEQKERFLKKREYFLAKVSAPQESAKWNSCKLFTVLLYDSDTGTIIRFIIEQTWVENFLRLCVCAVPSVSRSINRVHVCVAALRMFGQ